MRHSLLCGRRPWTVIPARTPSTRAICIITAPTPESEHDGSVALDLAWHTYHGQALVAVTFDRAGPACRTGASAPETRRNSSSNVGSTASGSFPARVPIPAEGAAVRSRSGRGLLTI